jgi:GntR family transcriptional regulator
MAVAKHEVVRAQLLDLVGNEQVGAVVPPERQLATELGVSRTTLRRVLGELVAEGYLTRRRGSGTFVAKPKIAQALTMTSFSEDMRRRGFTPGSRTLSLERTTAGARAGRWLEVPPQEPVIRAVRLRLADGEPMAIETLQVPAALVPGITAADLEGGSFYELLQRTYGVTLASGVQTTEPTVLTEEEAETLGVPPHSPAFLFERVTRDTAGRPVELVHSLYRGDRYKLVTELVPPRLAPLPSRASGVVSP